MQYGMTKPLTEKKCKIYGIRFEKKALTVGPISPTSTYLVCGFVLTLHDIADSI